MATCITYRLFYTKADRCVRRMASTLRDVFIYKGEGADDRNVDELTRKISHHLSSQKYNVQTISPEETIQGEWRSSAALYVIGGGYDLGFIRALGDDGTIQIRDYVRAGGRYLGICAGAYFACDSIEFDKDGPQQVCGERILKFFPGVCVGPVCGPYNYYVTISARATPVEFTDPDWNPKRTVTLYSYFNGGGMFLPQEHFKSCKITKVPETFDLELDEAEGHLQQEVEERHVLAVDSHDKFQKDKNEQMADDNTQGTIVDILCRFSEVKSQPIAAVKCDVGKGLAVLSSIHFEYDSNSLRWQDKFLKPIIAQISPFDRQTELCFGSLLQHAGLNTIK